MVYVKSCSFLQVLSVGVRTFSTSKLLFYEKNKILNDLLYTMDKETNVTLKHIKYKQRLTSKIPPPGEIYMQVLGNGSRGCPKSIFLFSDFNRYMFNCGEGTQRLATEHRVKLSRLEHLFCTYRCWENIGGLPGMALTLRDIGVPKIVIHGPPGLQKLFIMTKGFMMTKDMNIEKRTYTDEPFTDNMMTVNYVPIFGAFRNMPAPSDSDNEAEAAPSEDYYAYQNKYVAKGNLPKNTEDTQTTKQNFQLEPEPDREVAVAFVCKPHVRPGQLDFEKCVKYKIPPGPLLGQLKQGQDVVLTDGTVVKSEDVTAPDQPGRVFIVVECPTVDFLDSLLAAEGFAKHQAEAEEETDRAEIVVHLTSRTVMQHPKYQQWMNRFDMRTKHLVVNDSNCGPSSVDIFRLQAKLNLLHADIFPLLPQQQLQENGQSMSCMKPEDADANGGEMSVSVSESGNLRAAVDDASLQLETIPAKSACESSSKFSQDAPIDGMEAGDMTNNAEIKDESVDDARIIQGEALVKYFLRPHAGVDRTACIKINNDKYRKETLAMTGAREQLEQLRQTMEDLSVPTSSGRAEEKETEEYPEVVFLGTGSCIPNKARNVSAIITHVSSTECLLLDCGEGTYGQLCRFYGDRIDEVLRKLTCVFVSHLHADHHLGLVQILKKRKEACVGGQHDPLFIVAPSQLMHFLRPYSNKIESIRDQFVLIRNTALLKDSEQRTEECESLLHRLGLSQFETVEVSHCPHAFGCVLVHTHGWKLVYSGDTRPCESLVKADFLMSDLRKSIEEMDENFVSKDCDILIHEATMEDDLIDEARRKAHSTTSQAIEVGRKMNAKFIMLNHFSQRYSKVPLFSDDFTSNVGVSFDNMRVRPRDLPLLPLFPNPLRAMFADHYEEMEGKRTKRQVRKQLEMEEKKLKQR